MVYVLMLVVALAFGGFLWQFYSEPAGPRVTTPAAPASERPVVRPTVPLNPPAAPIVDESVVTTIERGGAAEAPVAQAETASPRIVANGPYVAQLAALQSEAGVQAAWRQIAARAPRLFAGAQLDVERADLGQRGVYHRVRAGYFADRESAARFCERVRETGQDCIVAAR
jgi:hypothetical protein